MKKTKRVFLSFLMMLAMGIAVIGFRPVKAQAATKSVKNIPYDTVLTNRISKYATVVKKGTTTLKLKANGNGYLRFKVPASKTYTFTFYDQTGDKLGFNNGYAYFLTPVKNRSDKIDLDKLQFSTYGGKTTTAWYHSKKYADTKKTTSAFLAKRICKMKLKKGQTIYIFLHVAEKGSLKLKIK